MGRRATPTLIRALIRRMRCARSVTFAYALLVAPLWWSSAWQWRRKSELMPNLRSAKKRLRIETKRRARNKTIKSAVRTQVTHARTAIATAPAEPTTVEAIRDAITALDRAVTKGVLQRNNAARRKSRLFALLRAAEA